MLKKATRHILSVIMAVILATPVFAVPVSAAAPAPIMTPVTASIPVSCPENGGKFVIEAASKAAPMPLEFSEIEVGDKGEGKFEIIYDEPGVYSYTIKQGAGTKKNVTYDKSVYNVNVHVYVDDESDLYCKIVIRKQGSSKKNPAAVYENKSPKKKSENKPKGSTSNPGTGGGVRSVKTGDVADIKKWALALGAASICLIAVIVMNRKKKEETA